ncbi:hypothetical protein [Vibrio europaeus]|uniref:hypothetical protein n=1 Tax=Vibrio europaeus TaxID=300876 RepID=UPI00148E17B0|nr:hypothetical protein [Vibrio europaeus]
MNNLNTQQEQQAHNKTAPNRYGWLLTLGKAIKISLVWIYRIWVILNALEGGDS